MYGFSKQLVILILLALYSFGAAGLNIQFHYCHQKLASVSIIQKAAPCCCKKKSDKPKKCCKDEVLKIQVGDHYPKFTFESIAFTDLLLPSPIVLLDNSFWFISTIDKPTDIYFPPLLYKDNPQSQFCVFLI
jgi:hypothetical protein